MKDMQRINHAYQYTLSCADDLQLWKHNRNRHMNQHLNHGVTKPLFPSLPFPSKYQFHSCGQLRNLWASIGLMDSYIVSPHFPGISQQLRKSQQPHWAKATAVCNTSGGGGKWPIEAWTVAIHDDWIIYHGLENPTRIKIQWFKQQMGDTNC